MSLSIHERAVRIEQTPAEKQPIRDSENLRWRDQVAAALLKAGMYKEHDLWIDCGDPALFFTPDFSGNLPPGAVAVNCCSDDPHHQSTAIHPTCQLRYCPDCCHRQTARLLNRYMPFLKGLVADSDDEAALRHIVLTTPIDLRDSDCRQKTAVMCDQVPLCFDELLGPAWRADYGLIFAYEFGEEGHKLHFHCLAYCPYIDQADIVAAWSKVTGGLCEVAYIRRVSDDPDAGQSLEDAVAEVLKYAAKLWKRGKDGRVVCLDPALVPALAAVLKGTRRIRSYGIFYKLMVEEEVHVCEVCSSPIIRLSAMEWNIYCNTGWMPVQFAVALRGAADQLNLILGNNFLDPGGGKTPIAAYFQRELPTLEAEVGQKYRNQVTFEEVMKQQRHANRKTGDSPSRSQG